MSDYITSYCPKIIQIHHQSKDGSTVMVAQKEIDSQDEMRAFIEKTRKDHPLPEGAQWFFCNEKSRHFVTTDEPT